MSRTVTAASMFASRYTGLTEREARKRHAAARAAEAER